MMTTKAKLTLVSLESALLAKIESLEARIDELESKPTRDRGPDSQHAMSDDDARRIIYGDMKNVSHKKAAEKLGLSYGQVYSARNGFTFKKINKEARQEAEIQKAYDAHMAEIG
jgi:hypothetical protein